MQHTTKDETSPCAKRCSQGAILCENQLVFQAIVIPFTTFEICKYNFEAVLMNYMASQVCT